MTDSFNTAQLQLLLPDGQIEIVELETAPERFVIGPNQRCHVVTDKPFDAHTPFLGIEKHGSHINVFQLPSGQKKTDTEPAPTQLFLNDAMNIGATTLMFVLLDQARALEEPKSSPTIVRAKPQQPAPSLDVLARALSFDTRPPDKKSALCKLELSQRKRVGEVDNRVDFDVLVTNTSSNSETMEFGVIGLPVHWVEVLPANGLLRPGESLFVQIRVTPDRATQRLAGEHHFVIGASSTRPEGPKAELGATFELEPFVSYSLGSLTPDALPIPWRMTRAKARIPLKNLGNRNQVFRVEAVVDNKNAQCLLQLQGETQKYARQTEFTVKPGEQKLITVHVKPLVRKLFQWKTPQSLLTVNAQALGVNQGLSATNAAVTVKPLFGRLWICVFALLLGLSGIFAMQPRIAQFDADNTVIVSGDTIVLSWVASPFSRLRLEPESRDLFGSSGSARIQPEQDTRYLLIAENFLSDFAPGFFGDQKQVTVYVDGNLPSIKFFSDVDTVVAGQPVNLWWEIENATRLTLEVNGEVHELSAEEHVSSRLASPTDTSIYILRAYNRHTSEDGVVASKTVMVLGGSQTIVGTSPNTSQPEQLQAPASAAVGAGPTIESFTVSPSSITSGQRVELNWTVTGVDEVTIRPVGQLSASGSLIQQPQQSTSYILTATSNGKEVQLVRQVIVRPRVADNPPPSVTEPEDDAEDSDAKPDADETPEAEATDVVESCEDPIILTFEASPDKFVKSNRPEEVTFSWDIDGDTTDVELRGPIVGKIDGFAAQDTWTQFLETSTTVTLIATDRDCRTSKTLQIVQDTPSPQLTSVSDPKTFVADVPLIVSVFGEGFTPESVVRVNNSTRPTTYLDQNTLTFELSALDRVTTTTLNVNVYSVSAASTLSNSAQIVVENPVPQISSINPSTMVVAPTPAPTVPPTVAPTSVATADPSVTPTAVPTATIVVTPTGLGEDDLVRIRITGSGFIPRSVVRVNDFDFPSEYVSSREIVLPIEVSRLLSTNDAVYLIDIWNPTPGGGSSNKIEVKINIVD